MKLRQRRLLGIVITAVLLVVTVWQVAPQLPPLETTQPEAVQGAEIGSAVTALESLEVKGRAAKTGYARAEFGDGWKKVNGCDTRNIILNRDMTEVVVDEVCRVVSGNLNDPYTGAMIAFTRENSSAVQIDHVIALSDAWQKGAQLLTREERIQLANDPLELIAADGPANQEKGDGDAATWLPKQKEFRCEYVARQIAVKQKYRLWVTEAEKIAMARVLAACPGQALPE